LVLEDLAAAVLEVQHLVDIQELVAEEPLIF
jgi:hypothetical protein